MKQPVSDPEEEREEKRRKKAYEKHKCRGCVWATWQKESVVMCLFPECVKEKGWKV
jgi:hypothetical protein